MTRMLGSLDDLGAVLFDATTAGAKFEPQLLGNFDIGGQVEGAVGLASAALAQVTVGSEVDPSDVEELLGQSVGTWISSSDSAEGEVLDDVTAAPALIRAGFVAGLVRWLHLPVDERLLALDSAAAFAALGDIEQARRGAEPFYEWFESWVRRHLESSDTPSAVLDEAGTVLSGLSQVAGDSAATFADLAAECRVRRDEVERPLDIESFSRPSFMVPVTGTGPGPAAMGERADPVDRAQVPARLVSTEADSIHSAVDGDYVVVSVPAFDGLLARVAEYPEELASSKVDCPAARLVDAATGDTLAVAELVLDSDSRSFEGLLPVPSGMDADRLLSEEVFVDVFDATSPTPAPATDPERLEAVANLQDALASLRSAQARVVVFGTPREAESDVVNGVRFTSGARPGNYPALAKDLDIMARRFVEVRTDLNDPMVARGRLSRGPTRPTLAELAFVSGIA